MRAWLLAIRDALVFLVAAAGWSLVVLLSGEW